MIKPSQKPKPAVMREELYLRMKQSLAAPPSRAGLAIKSEPTIARLVGLKRPTVRRVIDRLVEEGILVRRFGSGTYVRKVPTDDPLPPKRKTAHLPEFSLFEPAEERQHRRQPLNKDKAIRIATALPLSAKNPSAVYRHIFNALAARGKEIGAIVEEPPALKALPHDDAGKARLRKALDDASYDGLIVSSEDRVMLELLAGQGNRPVVYIDFANRDWNLPEDLAPMVSFDLRHAMINALRRLHSYGHKRIAVVGFSAGASRELNRAEDEILYNHVLDRFKLRYRQAVFLDSDKALNQERLENLFLNNPCTAVYFCDDVALMKAYPTLKKLGIKPGEDLAVITHANRGIPLPAGLQWSRMEFDPEQVATLILDLLVAEMKSALPDLISLAHKPAWVEGETHHLRAKSLRKAKYG